MYEWHGIWWKLQDLPTVKQGFGKLEMIYITLTMIWMIVEVAYKRFQVLPPQARVEFLTSSQIISGGVGDHQ